MLHGPPCGRLGNALQNGLFRPIIEEQTGHYLPEMALHALIAAGRKVPAAKPIDAGFEELWRFEKDSLQHIGPAKQYPVTDRPRQSLGAFGNQPIQHLDRPRVTHFAGDLFGKPGKVRSDNRPCNAASPIGEPQTSAEPVSAAKRRSDFSRQPARITFAQKSFFFEVVTTKSFR